MNNHDQQLLDSLAWKIALAALIGGFVAGPALALVLLWLVFG